MAMSDRKRLISTAIAVSLVGIVTGLFLGGGLLPSAADQQYNERTTTTTTETRVVHSHDDIPLHEHLITTVITITETTPHFWFHNFAAAMTSAPTGAAPTIAAPGANEVWSITREFRPMSITVPVGTTVTWTNFDNDEHTVTSYDGLFDARLQFSGATFSYTFDQRGTFSYHCDPHPEMIARVIVE